VASVGSRGDSYDNALAEAYHSLFKAELIRNKAPWKDVNHLEAAVAEYIDWYNCETCFSRSGTGWQDRNQRIRPVDVTLGTTDPKVSFCGLVRPRRWWAGARPAQLGSLIRRLSTPCGA
jgi:hypothetical protein